jgi:N-carbamoylputrescine amidase
MKIGCLQIAILNNVEENFSNIEKGLRTAREKGIRLVCLPELSAYPWFPAYLPGDFHIKFDNEYIDRTFSQMSKDLNVSIATTILRTDKKKNVYNTGVIFNNGEEILVYKKTHLPNFFPFWEKEWYKAGDGTVVITEIDNIKIGMLICSDIMYPEMSRLIGKMGAHVILVPRAVLKKGYKRWKIMLQANSIISGCYIVSANRIGTEDLVEFGGKSIIIKPGGSEYIEATTSSNDLKYEEIDSSSVELLQKQYPCNLESYNT